ncbi:uncharacterized protein LOC101896776 [Musca domestica]|uniref:Uncharacterized protein LOC101896776 n=1 Tax=Musca domestica TaxID=7370 RepID=A0A1I8MIK1_MUSDO|nr:uncharacterized protein LOC101896776 [Musca domestica]
MNKSFFILIGIIFTQVLANEHDWYPKDPGAIQDQCAESNPLTDESKADLLLGLVHYHPDLIAYIICTAKGMNFYTTEKGFDTERLLYALDKMNRLHNRNMVVDCVNKYKEIKSEYEMVYHVAKCLKEGNNADGDVKNERPT